MRGSFLSIAIAAIATSAAIGFTACSSKNGDSGVDVCSTEVPTPPACMVSCNPSPGSANTCPSGFHCTPDGTCDAQCTAGGSQCTGSDFCSVDGYCTNPNQGCTGIACNVASCDGSGQTPTTITGQVFAPNGTLPLYGVDVYVPNSALPDFPAGVQCTRCSDGLPGDPIVQTQTDEDGNFVLTNVPNGSNIPLVVSIGKWRREVTIPNITACGSAAPAAADTTLPKSMTDKTPNTVRVDMPMIALSTGAADSLECLLLRLGVDSSEMGTAGGTQHIQFFADTGLSGTGEGVSKFDSTVDGSASFADSASKLWDSQADLSVFDIVILSCEGNQYGKTKPQSAMDAMQAYADAGGRVFMSHWHNIWIEGDTEDNGMTQSPAEWAPVATWTNGGSTNDPTTDLIDTTNNPKGMSFAEWMVNVGGTTSALPDNIVLQNGTGKTTVNALSTNATRWTYLDVAAPNNYPQNFQFATPVGSGDAACGKVVFSDMHVSGSPGTGTYPMSCGTDNTLTPQEKALAFMLFDIATCVSMIE